ncbi:MAG TPA: flagellar hook-associated protein [Sediminispirochaeta sp.]|nr:flagellar hook-associated protein [Sediminispirochaeta sp.]
MSDISIPGVSSKYNTDKMIEAIMDVERVPLKRMERRIEEFDQRKRVWNEVNRKFSDLQTSARALYSFENPFREFVANSSDEYSLQASANRNAEKGLYQVEVKQAAGADNFRSTSLDQDFKVEAGTYRFRVGSQEIEFDFDGGKLDDFIRRLNRRGSGLIEAKTVKDTPKTSILSIRGTKTGAENALHFEEAAVDLGLKTGILKKVDTGSRDIPISENNVRTLSGETLKQELSIQNGLLQLPPQSGARLQISPRVAPEQDLQLQLEFRIENIPEEEYNPPPPPSGPELPPSGGVELDGIEVLNAPNELELPEQKPPEEPPRIDNLDILTVNDRVPLPSLSDTESSQTIQIPLSEIGETLSSLELKNENTHRRVFLESAKIVNPQARGDVAPAHPISQAQDALITVDGIPIRRATNEIDDAIPGLSLRPQRASSQAVEIEVEPDLEAIKDGLIRFLGNYNQAITEINILTSRQESVIDEIGYFEEDQREAAREKLGLFQGDTTFTQLKNRLQRIVTSAYETSAGRELSMLSQMGISTNAAGSSGVNRSKLRGYLEVDESRLDEVLTKNLEAVAELFGRDTDGDRVVDSGIAVEIHNYLNAYTQNGGIIETRTAGIDRQISNTDERIADLQSRLEDKEVDLKREYGRMESSLEQLQSNQRALDNFSNQNSQ